MSTITLGTTAKVTASFSYSDENGNAVAANPSSVTVEYRDETTNTWTTLDGGKVTNTGTGKYRASVETSSLGSSSRHLYVRVTGTGIGPNNDTARTVARASLKSPELP